MSELMRRILLGEVIERFEHPEMYAKAFYGGDAAGAISYTPINEQAALEPTIKLYIWDPLRHAENLPMDHSGMLIVVYDETAK